MTKPTRNKLIVIGVTLAILAVVVYVVLRKGSSWQEYARTDAPGNDIASQPSGTVDQDKETADKLGAVAFLRNNDSKTTYYKSSADNKQPITWANATLYVKK